MKLTFKSLLRRKIERTIDKLNAERDNCRKSRYGKEHRPEEFSRSLLQENEIDTQIKILKAVLK